MRNLIIYKYERILNHSKAALKPAFVVDESVNHETWNSQKKNHPNQV